MKTKRGLSRKEFDMKFGTNQQCITFLHDQKWNQGFVCRTCHHDQFRIGKKRLFKRCLRCGKEESPTAHTLFHKVKFDLYKAFGMIYDILISKKGANTIWLAERYEVSQNTAWLFKRKVQYYLASSKNHPLRETVHVDEFEIGTPKTGEQGRSVSQTKKRVVIATEILENGKMGNAYAQIINDFSSKSLIKIFNDHIDKDARIKTDKWTGYRPIKEFFKGLSQEISDAGKNFPEIHIQIRNFKNWLRGTHSFCTEHTLQDYINEYFYRFNRRNNRNTIVDNALINRFLRIKPPTYSQITSFAT